MLSGEKILLSGGSGALGFELGRELAKSNEVWSLARYGDPASRAKVEAAGMRPVAVDLERPDFSGVAQDFTYLLHFAHARRGADAFVEAIQINAVGAGLLMQHCRKAKAALVVSSTAVYSPAADPFQPMTEPGDIGRAYAPWAPSSPVSKVSLEAVARFAAEAFGLPTSIMRLNTTYGAYGGMPVFDLKNIAQGAPVRTWADPYPHSPIHLDDMAEQIEALLDAAAIPANIINWCGDEVVTQRQWCDYAGELTGKPVEFIVNAMPGAPTGNVGDNAKRLSVTGPCKRPFKAAFSEIYESVVKA
jgi:nucleoside-diphosphate-sugar epimerase